MATTNFYIAPSDGWVQIADSPKFARVSGYPHTHPFFLFSGSAAPSLVPAKASQTFTFATTGPVANDTITIGAEVYTFKVVAPGPFDVALGADFHAAATNFTAKVNLNSTLVTAVDAADVVTVTARAAGPGGNAITTVSAATNVTAGGAKLTGGAIIPQGIQICHHAFKVNVTMTEKLFARIVNPTRDANGGAGQIRLDVFTIT